MFLSHCSQLVSTCTQSAKRCCGFFSLSSTARITAARGAMALAALSGDEQRILFTQLCNVLDPRLAVAFSSVNRDLRASTQAQLPQLKADHEAAAALCRKVGLSRARRRRTCNSLNRAKGGWFIKGSTHARTKLHHSCTAVIRGKLTPRYRVTSKYVRLRGSPRAHAGHSRCVAAARRVFGMPASYYI